MFEIQTIENDMGCEASLWCFQDRTARLVMSSTSVDFSNADGPVESFRKELAQLQFTELNVEIDKDQNTLTVGCRFRLPWFRRDRKIQDILSAVFSAYYTHLGSMMKTRDDAFFGQLIWDGSLSRWKTEIEIDGDTVPLSIRDWGDRDVSETLQDAQELIENWEQWRSKIDDAQIRDLLNLYNDTWRDDDSPRLTSTELQNRLSISSVDCEDSGWRCVYYDQDDLFTDHIIEMRISPEGEVEAVIAG